jgi:hypothetical protein
VIVLNASGGEASKGLLNQLDKYIVNEISSMLTHEAEERRLQMQK